MGEEEPAAGVAIKDRPGEEEPAVGRRLETGWASPARPLGTWCPPRLSMTRKLGDTATRLLVGPVFNPVGDAVAIAGLALRLGVESHSMTASEVGSGVGEEVGFRVGLGATVTGDMGWSLNIL